VNVPASPLRVEKARRRELAAKYDTARPEARATTSHQGIDDRLSHI